MPALFTSGGTGAHWLLPNSLSFTNPSDPSDKRILTAADVKSLVVALHSEMPPSYVDGEKATAVETSRETQRTRIMMPVGEIYWVR